jgi:hypothetical protein
MPINSRRKGCAGERELAHRLEDLGFPGCRRGQQFRGGPDSPDVIGVQGAHIECKRVKRAGRLPGWMKKAASEAKERTPFVFVRADREEDFLVTMRIQDWANLWLNRKDHP